MSERVREVWVELESLPAEPEGWDRRLLFPERATKLYAAIRFPERTRMLLLKLPLQVVRSVSPGLTHMRGIRVRAMPDTDDPEAAYLSVSLVEPRLADPFDSLVDDLAAALAPPMPPRQQGLTLIDRLDHWRDLFAAYRGEELSLPARTGLFGELRWLRFMVTEGAPHAAAVTAWRGSPGADQDFVGASIAVEVKTTAAGETLPVSSERQLDETPYVSLFLVNVEVEAGDTGSTLPEEVDAVRALLGSDGDARLDFEARLAQVGYSDVHRDRYEDVRYRHASTRAFDVQGAFPRLTPAALPPGVQGVTYRISAAECLPFTRDPSEVAALLTPQTHSQ